MISTWAPNITPSTMNMGPFFRVDFVCVTRFSLSAFWVMDSGGPAFSITSWQGTSEQLGQVHCCREHGRQKYMRIQVSSPLPSTQILSQEGSEEEGNWKVYIIQKTLVSSRNCLQYWIGLSLLELDTPSHLRRWRYSIARLVMEEKEGTLCFAHLGVAWTYLQPRYKF